MSQLVETLQFSQQKIYTEYPEEVWIFNYFLCNVIERDAKLELQWIVYFLYGLTFL